MGLTGRRREPEPEPEPEPELETRLLKKTRYILNYWIELDWAGLKLELELELGLEIIIGKLFGIFGSGRTE